VSSLAAVFAFLGCLCLGMALWSARRAREERVARAALARLGIPIPVPPADRLRAWRTLIRLGFPEPLAARICGVPDA